MVEAKYQNLAKKPLLETPAHTKPCDLGVISHEINRYQNMQAKTLEPTYASVDLYR